MTVQVDARNHVVRVDDVVDLAAAHAVREAVLAMEGDVAIDFRDARDVDDSALLYLVTTLSSAEHEFTFRGLGWPHADLLEYLAQRRKVRT